jgi:hypothetical protein
VLVPLCHKWAACKRFGFKTQYQRLAAGLNTKAPLHQLSGVFGHDMLSRKSVDLHPRIQLLTTYLP